MQVNHEQYIRRCFTLARQATMSIKSNPPVGAVLVYKDRIIGEGYHQTFGESHAEVNAVKSVKKADQALIKDSTLYVSLEPCCFEGKTPACTGLIQSNNIKTVVISTLDPNVKVAGQGLRLLEEAGVSCVTGILESEGLRLIRGFRAHLSGRPQITLKWAKSKHDYLGHPEKQIWLSNAFSKVLAHKLRAEHEGILIGTNTAIVDNPSLTTRDYPGANPMRIVLDKSGRISPEARIFTNDEPTLLVTQNQRNHHLSASVQQLILDFQSENFISDLLKALFLRGIYRILVEGGSKTLKSFIKTNYWDQAYVISTQNPLNEGLKAPNLQGILLDSYNLEEDQLQQIGNADFKGLSTDC